MKPIRIAFSGSGFKAPAHVGALCAVHDAGYEPTELAGTSGGSIVAALCACGVSPQDMHELVMTQDWARMLTFDPWSALTKLGYCSGDALLTWLTEMTGGRAFDELDRTLTVMASDLNAMAPAEFSLHRTPKAQVAQAVRASTAIPFVYAPVRVGPSVLVDGGLVNNIPADKLFALLGTPRLGVQLVSQSLPIPAGGLTLGAMVSRTLSLILSAQESAHVDLDALLGVQMVFVETGYASGLDSRMPVALRQRLFDDGYKATQLALKSFSA